MQGATGTFEVSINIAPAVTTPFTFNLGVSPQSGVIYNPPGTGSFTITATLTGGSPLPVQLSLLGLPTGTTYSFSTSSVTPNYVGTTVTLTISAAGLAQGTIYTATITGTEDDD